ncbi:MAG: peptidylprolyl isomerase [Cardiobacteriaceae bacterium]|nr:peptidylprolyl isomerase [Cardiobacteriaceae bacterium]
MKPTILLPFLLGVSLISPAQNLTFGPANTPQNKPIDEIGIVINDEAITRRQLAQEIEEERRHLPKELNLPADAVQKQLIEQVIMTHILAQLEKRAGLEISDDEVNEAIAQIAARNHLSEKALYAQAQRDTGLKQEEFRAQIRKSLALDHIKEGVIGNEINITDRQVDDYLAKIAREKGSTLHIQDLLIPVPEGDASSRASEVEAKIVDVSHALHESNNDLRQASSRITGAQFNDLGEVNLGKIPPRFARALAKLGTGDIVENPVVDADGMHFLKVVSKHNAGEDYTLDEANVSHILLRTNDARDDSTQKARIEAIYRDLQNGADFAALARRYSEDTQSAAKGGELGWTSSDQVGSEFAQAMQTQPIGSISKPIRASYGYHIILVHDRRQTDKSEELPRQQIKRNLYAKAAEEAWQQRLQSLRREAYVEIR